MRRIGRAAAVGAIVMFSAAGAARANAVLLCGWSGCELLLLGPHTPNPRSSPHMSFRIHPYRVKAEATLHATARGFLPREYVTIWDYSGHRLAHSEELPGGNATGAGRLSFIREILGTGVTPAGRHKICLQGERSRRVACASYYVVATSTTGPGYVAPGSTGSGAKGSGSPGSGSTGTGSTGTTGWTAPTVGPGLGT